MSELDYTYAAARIRVLELSLFSASVLEQLIGCASYEEALKFLMEKGWGGSEAEANADEILDRESRRTWEVVRELCPDMSIFDVMRLPDLFHNLKAAIKQAGREQENPHIFYQDTKISPEEMLRVIREKDYLALPKNMQKAAQEATEAFLQTGDGQLCDIIVDQAALEAIKEAGKEAKEEILRQYAESMVAVADIKIAVRAQKTGKNPEFMRRAMAECESLNTDRLIQTAVSGKDALMAYLEETDYAGGAAALAESASAFERWCDNRMIEIIRPQKYKAFSIGPVVAYAIARENEIKTVRIILSGKANGLSDDSIRERVREMYV